MILVDLDVPAGCDDAALRDALTRWSQEARFAAVTGVRGVVAGDARGVIVPSSLDDVILALATVTQ